MKETNLSQLIEKAEKEVIDFGYSKSLIEIYNNCFDELKLYFNQQSIEYFERDLAINYVKNKFKITEINSKSKTRWRWLYLRACEMLDDINNGNKIKKCYLHLYNHRNVLNNPEYNNVLNTFVEYLINIGLSDNVTNPMLHQNKRFLIFLENRKIDNLKSLNYNLLLDFITTMPPKRKTRNLYLYYLRTFLGYLYEKKFINEDLSLLISNFKIVKNDKVPSVWDFKDVKMLLNSIDKTTAKGKRDYAIIVLALTTSMRGIDIVKLKISNIDFINNKISFIQQKTKNSVTLPLLESTKEAIKDYILEARPNSKYENLFLTVESIPTPISRTGTLTNIIQSYVNKINLNINQKRGIHSFRHTVLNYLFNDNETSITTITEISGHIKPESLNPYIKTDFKKLKEFTLNKKDFGNNEN